MQDLLVAARLLLALAALRKADRFSLLEIGDGQTPQPTADHPHVVTVAKMAKLTGRPHYIGPAPGAAWASSVGPREWNSHIVHPDGRIEPFKYHKPRPLEADDGPRPTEHQVIPDDAPDRRFSDLEFEGQQGLPPPPAHFTRPPVRTRPEPPPNLPRERQSPYERALAEPWVSQDPDAEPEPPIDPEIAARARRQNEEYLDRMFGPPR